MENKEMADATSSRRLRLPVCPYSRTTTGVPQAGNFHHHPYSSHRPFQHNPAASSSSSGGGHFSSPAGPPTTHAYQLPLSPTTHAYQLPLSPTTHAYAGGASPSLGPGGSMPMDIGSGSGCTATFHSSLVTASSSLVHLQVASSSSLPTPSPGCQLPPLPPSLGGPPLLQTATALHPAGRLYRSGSSSLWMHQPHSSGNTGLTQPPWTPVPSSNTLQLGKNTITSGSGSSSSSSAWVPLPAYTSGNTGLTRTPWTPVPSSTSLPATWTTPVQSANTSQLGKNIITSGGSSSAWMTRPAYSSGNKGHMVVGSKRKLPSSPATAWGSGAAGSSIQYKDNANAPLFTQDEIDKIKVDKDLNDIFCTDPKKVRSILNLRRNSQRSTEKKAAYLSGLEHKVEQLHQETKLLSGLVNSEQSTIFGLTAEKNEMMIKIQGFEQRIQLMDAVNETLYAEFYRLKLAAGEMRGSHVSNSSNHEMNPQTMQQEMNPQTMQQENLQIQDHELTQFMHELEPLVDIDNLLA